MILFLGKDTGTKMASRNQRHSYLLSTLKKMGYEGNPEDLVEIKKFLRMNSNHALYAKAVGHLNELINMSYVYKRGYDFKNNVRYESNLYGGHQA